MAGQCLARGEGLKFLSLARKDYEYIVIHGAPILPSVEVLPLARNADEVFLTVKAGQSRFSAVHEAWQRLHLLGVPLHGAIVGEK